MKNLLLFLTLTFNLSLAFANDHLNHDICFRDVSIKESLEKQLKKDCNNITQDDLLKIKRLELSNIYLNSKSLSGLKNLEVLKIEKIISRDMSGVLDELKNIKIIKLSFLGQEVQFTNKFNSKIQILPDGLNQLEIFELHNLIIVGRSVRQNNNLLPLSAKILTDKYYEEKNSIYNIKSLKITNSNINYFSFNFFGSLPQLVSADFSNNQIDFFVGSILLDSSLAFIKLNLSGNPLDKVDFMTLDRDHEPLQVLLCNVPETSVNIIAKTAIPSEKFNFVLKDCR